MAFARGSLSARAYAGERRPLSSGGPVYEGDTLETGSRGFAVVALRDRGRVTLQPGTEFRIDELRFEPAEAERGSVLMRLLRGGLRVVSGLIGQARKEAYRMRTPVATIGRVRQRRQRRARAAAGRELAGPAARRADPGRPGPGSARR